MYLSINIVNQTTHNLDKRKPHLQNMPAFKLFLYVTGVVAQSIPRPEYIPGYSLGQPSLYGGIVWASPVYTGV
jgi:hypothetical protein